MDKRNLKQFTLTEDVKVLQSTASDLNGVKGGGAQYFSPELKNKVIPVCIPPPDNGNEVLILFICSKSCFQYINIFCIFTAKNVRKNRPFLTTLQNL